MKTLLKILLNPSCWMRLGRTSKVWDRQVQELMATHKFTNYNGYTAKLGNFVIWVANYPYSYGYWVGPDLSEKSPLPSRATVFELAEKLERDTYEQHS